jgi:tetratricopeptide (TPR) repeat protein
MKNLGEYVIYMVLNFILADNDPADEALRNHQYKRLVNEWVKKPACSDYLDFIDNLERFYPEAVIDALNSRKATPEAVASLRAWQNRFPEITGPARYLCFLLNLAGNYEEAILVMDKAISKGFHKAGVTSCYYYRMQSWHGRGAAASQINKEEARRCLRKSLSDAVYVINNSKKEEEVSAAKEMQTELKKYV